MNMNSNSSLTTQKGVDVLKKVLDAPSVQKQFTNALDKNSPSFIASIIDLYNGDSALQKCAPQKVVAECLKAAVLKLPINESLGFAYVIPYNNSVRDDATGAWIKIATPTFQIGYKGYIQLAMRTGQYRTINADVVYEGELRKVNKLTGEISFDGEKKSDKVTGYFAYIELLNGFSKTLYMTVEQTATHAKRYSLSLKFKKEVTVESLMSLANLPVADAQTVGWLGNFHGMAMKTVIRLLISKYGYLSIEMQNALADETDESADDNTAAAGPQIEINDVQYEEVNGNGNVPEQQPAIESKDDEPGY
jgi:recombination protein RecT